MPESANVSLRLPAKLLAALRRKAAAAKLTVGQYLRRLAEQDTGVSAGPMPQGLASMDAAKLAEVTTAGAAAANKARWGERRKK